MGSKSLSPGRTRLAFVGAPCSWSLPTRQSPQRHFPTPRCPAPRLHALFARATAARVHSPKTPPPTAARRRRPVTRGGPSKLRITGHPPARGVFYTAHSKFARFFGKSINTPCGCFELAGLPPEPRFRPLTPAQAVESDSCVALAGPWRLPCIDCILNSS
jgi:hypothetical protein